MTEKSEALRLADALEAYWGADLGHDRERQAAAELRRLHAVESKYNELLFAVGSKRVGETRHDTALRYIKQAEDNITYGPAKAEGEPK
jgi:hypothetical protein